ARANLVEVNEPLANQDACASNVRCLNDAVLLFRTSNQRTRSAHLDPLCDAPNKAAVRLSIVVSEQSGQRAISASGRWVFRNAAQWRKHASTNVKTVVGVCVQIHIWHDVLSSQGFKSAHVDVRTFERRTIF